MPKVQTYADLPWNDRRNYYRQDLPSPRAARTLPWWIVEIRLHSADGTTLPGTTWVRVQSPNEDLAAAEGERAARAKWAHGTTVIAVAREVSRRIA